MMFPDAGPQGGPTVGPVTVQVAEIAPEPFTVTSFE